MTPLASTIARLMFPASLAVAAALLLTGYSQVGGGFSAGMLAGLGAVLEYLALDRRSAQALVGTRWAWGVAVGGLLVLLTVVWAPLVVGQAPVSHWPPPGARVAHFGPLELHTALLFDLGVALLVYGAVVLIVDRLLERAEEEL